MAPSSHRFPHRVPGSVIARIAAVLLGLAAVPAQACDCPPPIATQDQRDAFVRRIADNALAVGLFDVVSGDDTVERGWGSVIRLRPVLLAIGDRKRSYVLPGRPARTSCDQFLTAGTRQWVILYPPGSEPYPGASCGEKSQGMVIGDHCDIMNLDLRLIAAIAARRRNR